MPNMVSCLRSVTVIFAGALVCAVTLVAGCGSSGSSDTAHWSGNVTVGGSPAPNDARGSITFRPQGNTGKPVTVQIENGQYDSPATPKGKVIAYIDLQQPTGKTQYSERRGEEIPIMKNLVPPNKMRGVEFEVADDKLDAHIEL